MITSLQTIETPVAKPNVVKPHPMKVAGETALFVQDDTLLGMGLESLCGSRLAELDVYCLSPKGLVQGRSRDLAVSFAMIDATGHSEVGALVRIVRDAHGKVPVALAVGDDRHCPPFVYDLIEREEITGVIGAGATRENWEIVVQYLLSGGRYLPPRNEAGRPDGAVRGAAVAGDRTPPSVVSALSSVEPFAGGSTAPLTRREIDVMMLAAEGMQNKIIAHTLGLSEHTIKVHMQHAFRKLGAKNRTQAAGAFNALRR